MKNHFEIKIMQIQKFKFPDYRRIPHFIATIWYSSEMLTIICIAFGKLAPYNYDPQSYVLIAKHRTTWHT